VSCGYAIVVLVSDIYDGGGEGGIPAHAEEVCRVDEGCEVDMM
jgi:hypothetical protein